MSNKDQRGGRTIVVHVEALQRFVDGQQRSIGKVVGQALGHKVFTKQQWEKWCDEMKREKEQRG